MTQQPEPTQPLDMAKVLADEIDDPAPTKADVVEDPATDETSQ